MTLDTNRLIGLPYRWGARGPDAYDCWGLVVHALELMGIPCTDDWAPENPACARDLIAIERHNASRWRRVPDGDQPGRIALLGNAKRYFHVGVTVPRCRILHTTRETGAVIQRPAMLRACGYSRIAFYEAAAWVR